MFASAEHRSDPVTQRLTILIGFLSGALTLPEPSHAHRAATGLRQRLDLVAVMITVIIAGVVGMVGLNIMSNTEETTSLSSGDTFFAAQENLTDGIGQFFSQLGTVFVVIVLVVIIGYLMLLRGRR